MNESDLPRSETVDTSGPLVAGAARRMYWFIAASGVVGAAFSLQIAGRAAALGFLLGAGFAFLNYHWLQRTVDMLGPGGRRRPGPLFRMALIMRYPLLAMSAYAIVNYFEISALAVLAGAGVAAAAAILEILYELIYGRT